MKQDSSRDTKHVTVTLLSTFCNTGLGLLANFWIIKILPPIQYGIYSSVLAIILVSQEITGRGINDALLRLGSIKVKTSLLESARVFSVGIVLKFFFFLFFAVCYVASAPFILKALRHPGLSSATGAVLCGVAGYGIWTTLLTRRQAQFAFTRLAFEKPLCNLIRFLLLIGVYLSGLLWWQWIIWIYGIAFFISSVLAGWGDFAELARIPLSWKQLFSTAKDIWRLASWNTIASISYVAFSRLDIMALTAFQTETDVAVYNTAWQVLTVIDLCTISIMTAMIPKVCHCDQRDSMKEWIWRSVRASMAIGILCWLFIFLASLAIPAFLDPIYKDSVRLIYIMFPAYLVTLLVFPLIGIMYAANRFRMLALINMGFIPVGILIYWLGVKTMGTEGVAYGTTTLKLGMSLVIAAAIWKSLPKQETAKAQS